MAILEKRRAVNQLPRFQRYQDTRAGDRAAALRGETPITSAIRQLAGSSGYGPMGDSEGFNPMGGGRGGAGPMGGGMGGAGKGTVDKFGNVAGQPKTAVTSALKGATAAENNAIASKAAGTGATAGKVAGTTSKLPGLTSKTTDATGKAITSAGTGAGKTAGVTGAKTLTSTGSGAGKTTGVTGTTGAKTTGSSGSSLGKTLTSALTGAALGAGTKFVIDKLTGKKTSDTGANKTSGTVKDSGTGLKGNTSNIGGNIGKTITDKVVTGVGSKVADTVTKKVNDGITSVVKGTGTTGVAKKVTDGVTKKVSDTVASKVADKVTSAVKPKSPVTPATKTGATKAVTPKGGTPKTGGAATKTAADIKDENPELTDEEVEAELDRIRDEEESLGVPEGAEDNGDGTYSVTEDGMVTTYDADGNIVSLEAAEDTDGQDDADGEDDGTTTQVMEDGTVVTLDANGDIVSYTDTDGVEYDADGNEIEDEIVGGGDVGGEGNTTETLEDGTQITYDEDGDIVSYTDTDGVTYDGDGEVIGGEDTTTGGGTRGIGGGSGGDGSDEEEIVADEEEAYDGLYSDDEGNLYDAEGNFVQYADGTLAGDEDYAEGAVAYTDEYGNTYDYNGDLLEEGDYSDYVQYDEDGNSYNFDGELIEYADGTTDDEYTSEDEYAADDEYTSDDEYSYEDDYSYEDEYDVKKGGIIHMEKGGDPSEGDDEEDGEPIEEEENEDGTITQYFDDGSSITYDADGEVYEVTDATEDEEAPALTARGITVGANNQRYNNVDTAANYQADSRLTGADSTRLQSFLDDIPRTSAVASGESNAVTTTSPPEGWPAGFSDNFDGTATYVDDDGSTVTIDADSNIVFVTDAYGDVVAQDGEAVTTSDSGQANQNIQYFDDGSYIQTFDDGTSITFDADGNAFRATDSEGNSQLANTSSYDDYGNQTISDYYGNIVKVLDPQGNVIPLGGGRVNAGQITSAGSTGAVNTDTESEVQRRIAELNEGRATKSAIDDLLAGLNTYGGAGAAGAVLGALLSDSDLFSGGGGGGHSFDMTGVGAIDPRTTDFGIGPANYVGYDQYGTPEQMPELYGRELYQNLNAPGFNEVNPGDYARYDEEEFGPSDQYYEEPMDEVQPMAEGGTPTGGLNQTAPQTYYTFGTPVDPLQNLRNPAPYQQQQPQMQSQMPPQAAQNAQQAPQGMQPMGMMPQMSQGMPPAGMKRGGLPALSNVPITQGRLNFRQGAAVHGPGDGQSDDIPAMLADGEYVIDAETVAQIGNGSTKAGAQALDKFRENIRMHKRSAPVNKIPPKTKALTSYLKGAR